MTTDMAGRLANLTPDQQRELLAKLLREKAEKANTFPMSAGQQGLWHAFRRDPNATPFNVFLPTRVRSALNLDAFRSAMEWIVSRHASLRATFSDSDGKLTQRIHQDAKPEFTVVDLPGASDEQVRSVVTREMTRPFDLEKGPLLRIFACRLATDDWIVVAITHHIVVDFWSLVLILKELRHAYPSYAAGREPANLPFANNYSQFVEEQAKTISSVRGQSMKNFWQRTLAGTSTVVDWPTDFIRPATFHGEADVTSLRFPSSIVPKIAAFAARHRVTAFAVVQSALQVLVSRYSGQKSFCIGSPFSGRSHQKFENTVGFFVNMLPLKANLEEDPTFVELVSQTSATLLDALENEDVPIAQIVQDAGIPRDLSRSPLFQVSCTFEKSQLKEESGRAGFLFPDRHQSWDFGGLRQESFYVPHPTCHYDLEFIFELTDKELRGMLCYCRHLFDEKTAKKISENFSLLLDRLLANSERRTSRIAWGSTYISSADRASQPTEWNIDTHQSAGMTVDRMIRDAAEKNPVGSALVMAEQRITYEQLLSRCDRLASILVARGASPNMLVPIIAERGPLAFAAMLAVNRAGAAFVPIDSSQPSFDLRQVAQDLKASLLITDGTATLPTGFGLEHVIDLRDFLGSQGTTATAPALQHTPNDLAYVVYTSGSTGQPKGVMVDHSAVCNTLAWRARDVPLNPTDRVLMLLSHQFDAGLGIAWTTLTQGASLILADSGAQTDPSQLIDQMMREHITVLPAVPSLLRVLIAHPRFSACTSLRYIWTGGEAMPTDLPEQIRAVSRARFWNFYGPTEAAIEATAGEVTDHDPARPVPIGRPIEGAEVLVLDEHRRVVPDTLPGELAIGGMGLARGYLNRPELTAEKFVPHPLEPTSGRLVYLTGDRGRKNADGEIEFLGRTDHQVKLRGYRIELGEIESILDSHYLVERSAVKLVGEGSDNAQLLAFASLTPNMLGTLADPADRQNTSVEIRRFLSEQLPAYKLPTAILVLDSMPLTSSGKVDRKQLPDSVPAELLEQQVATPTNELEVYLANAWCESLGLERVSVIQNFFDAGGSSLQAAILASRLSEDLGVHIPTALFFDLADISKIATRLVELHPQQMTERFGEACVEKIRAQLSKTRCNTGFENETDFRSLIAPLKPSGSRKPIFMVHPPGGIVVCYRALAHQLPRDQPLFGIRSRGLHGDEKLPDNLTQMATEYVAAIRSVQPTGPYTVGGWSLGGLLAYEMAQQLIISGQQVAKVLLLDTTIPQGSTDLVPQSEQVNVGLEYGIELTLDQLGELAPEDQLPFLWEHAKKLGVLDDNSPPEVVAQALEDLQSLFHHHVEVSRTYQIATIDCPIELFRPINVPFELKVSEDRGWGYLAERVTVHFVPGHHHSMVQPPHVAELAKSLVLSLQS